MKQQGPICGVYPDGRLLVAKREMIRVDDWRDTPVGPVNFGMVIAGPWSLRHSHVERHPR